MLRFRQFVEGQEVDYLDGEQPEDIARRIYKNCKPFLEESGFEVNAHGDPKSCAWRGVSNLSPSKVFFTQSQVKWRRPTDTNPKIHGALDGALEREFGHKYRSEGIFGSGAKKMASGYGTPYLFFPIGSFSYVWSPKIEDAYHVFDGAKHGVDPEALEIFHHYFGMDEIHASDDSAELLDEYTARLQQLLSRDTFRIFGYTDDNLAAALRAGVEIMFHCPTYYLLFDAYPHYTEPAKLNSSRQVLESLGKFLNPR